MKTNPAIPAASPASVEDLNAIEKISRDYYDSWFTADVELMGQVVHPELAKRGIWHDLQNKTWRLKHLSAEAMIGYTREGGGSTFPESEKVYEIEILDVFRDIANVKVSSYPYMDYLHLAKINGRWWIVNALYEFRHEDETSP